MPIYEFACPRCRRIFSFLSKTSGAGNVPACPKCGSTRMAKQLSAFSTPRGLRDSGHGETGAESEPPMPDMDDPRMVRAMSEMERELEGMDENNPRHMAHLMKKMKQFMPEGTVPKEMDTAIKRLEAGEDPEKIEEDMGDVLGDFMGGDEGEGSGGYAHDSGLYDM